MKWGDEMARSSIFQFIRRSLTNDEHILNHLHRIHERLLIQMTAIEDLTANVANNTTVIGSAISLIQGLKGQIDEMIAAGNDDPALQDLSDQLGSSDADLAAAVEANTPAAAPAAPAAEPGAEPTAGPTTEPTA